MRGVDHPLPLSAEVKGRIELCLLFSVWVFMACSRVNFLLYFFKYFIKHNILFTYTSSNILIIMGIAFSMLLGPDERL